MHREAFAVGALLALDDDCDPNAVGAAVTTALCGTPNHSGHCRWPHNNAIDLGRSPARFRTLVIAPSDDVPAVEERIRGALASADAWTVVEVRLMPVADSDRELANRLMTGPYAEA